MKTEMKFLDKIEINWDTMCWEWKGRLEHNGYARFWDGEKMVRTHRWAYERLRGPIPEGYDIDHLCRNRRCSNPEHLEPVTRKENVRRSPHTRNSDKECKRGHDMTIPANIKPRENGYIQCRECKREDYRQWYHRQREEKP